MESTSGGDAEPAQAQYTTFDQMDLSPEVRAAVLEDMKYVTPTPVQSATFGPVREGKDVVVQSRTGTGKTAAFGIPLADRIDPGLRAPQLMVLAPTRELANQDNTELERINKRRGNRCVAIYGGAAFGPQLEALRAGSQIVVGTPGRVLDHLRRGTLKLDQLRYFILDEADEMLSMGFQDELEAILEFVPKKRQTMLFSATFPPEIKQIIARYLTDPQDILLSQGNISVDKITHYYYVTSHMRKPQTLLTVLEHEEPEAAIIFTNTRDDANFIGNFLANRGHDAEILTGELTQSSRERVMKKIKTGNLRYLVATDVAARGIDINDLSHVINYNLPESPEVYVHRTGRTGRAGKSGTAVSIVSGLDISTLYALTRWMKINLEERPIPSEAELRTHKLDREIKKLVGEVRGKLEEGRFADPEDRWLLLAERLMLQPHLKEVVAHLLEKVLVPPPPVSAERAAAEAAATERAKHLTGGGELDRSLIAEDVSPEQREFEEQQMRKHAGGRGARDGRREGRGREREGRGGRERDRGPRGDRPRDDRPRDDRPRDRERPREAAPRPAGDSKTVIVTLGRRQRMAARDVGMFVVQGAGIEVNQIRDVRVRDGYSFLDVDPAALDKVLSVNGKEHQGKPVKVEIARRQAGERPSAEPSAAQAPEPASAGEVTPTAPPPGEGQG